MNLPTPSAQPCAVCGAYNLRAIEKPITRKRRSKFGLLWLVATFLTLGIALVAYLVWPRHNEVVGVDRYLECSSCGARQ